ncbi:MAG: VOC family protein [Candidatus Eremiobacteraeota bacterium]|nr:VOC family protein [Candidatus Eremiobacteraeota bacterium]
MSPPKLDRVGIVVGDLDATARIYIDTLGFTQIYRETLAERGVEVLGLSAGDTTIELIRPLDDASAAARYRGDEPAKLYHLTFTVGDVNAELERIKSAGVEPLDSQPRRNANGGVGIFLHPDSTGDVLIEISQKV